MFSGCTKELSLVLTAVERLKSASHSRLLDCQLLQEVLAFAESDGLLLLLVDKQQFSIQSELSIGFPCEFTKALLEVGAREKFNNLSLLRALCKSKNSLADLVLYDLDNRESRYFTLVAFNNKRSNKCAPASYLIQLILPYLHQANLALISKKRPAHSTVDTLQILTVREREVLDWIHSGKTNSEIGMILGISTYTVKNHVANILEKLNAPNRFAAMAITLSHSAFR